MTNPEFTTDDRVPDSGVYEELNIFGTPTGRALLMEKGETLPAVPRGYTFRSLASLSVVELRAKAAHYREMAATARTQPAMLGLLRVAERLDAVIKERQRGD